MKVITTEMGVQASSLKMAYAGYTKGSSALLILINAFAELAGVRESLSEEWELSQPDLLRKSEQAAKGTAAKAWRFVGEMEEIAKTMNSSDLPEGFHKASAGLYSLMAQFKDAKTPDLNEVLQEIISLRIGSRLALLVLILCGFKALGSDSKSNLGPQIFNKVFRLFLAITRLVFGSPKYIYLR